MALAQRCESFTLVVPARASMSVTSAADVFSPSILRAAAQAAGKVTSAAAQVSEAEALKKAAAALNACAQAQLQAANATPGEVGLPGPL